MKIEVTAFPRAQQGSSASRRLRVAGRVPGIVYGADKAAQNVEVDHKDLLRNLGLEAFHASILDMTLNGEKFQALLRDYQMHPWRKQVVHVDFQRVDKNRKIHMRVPLHFVNAEICPGVKTGGGVVQHTINAIEIQCLPDDLPAYIEVDLKDMELNDTLHVMELAMPKGVEPTSKLRKENPSVVSVHVPKEIVIEEEAAAPVTEIIGEKPAEGEEAAAGAEGEKKEGAPAGEKKEAAAADKKEPAKKGKE
ncbi:MAG TPA: 50S ribosomal protein L25/general stress protein Ctc [Burkholderiales bacterium]|nr:50S ribosomal protein L25/general stress protein Ctc [Burkholderiales bacterium]